MRISSTGRKISLMISYGRFEFASPPRTATTWFLKAADLAGLGGASKASVHIPPKKDQGARLVSIVRHPYRWLSSYFHAIGGGIIGIPEIDFFGDLVRKTKSRYHDFIFACAENPGCVKRMFDAYPAFTVMRVEDLPWAAIEFFESVVPEYKFTKIHKNSIAQLPKQNQHEIQGIDLTGELTKTIIESEAEFCEKYEYYGD